MSELITPKKKAARIQTAVCGFLFSIFSFVYLYVFQHDVLEAIHYSLAHGKTHYVPLASALIVTAVLLLLRWGVNSLLGLKGEIRALSYFPSCIVLGAMTDATRSIYMQNHHTSWTWLLPTLILLFIVITYWLRRVFRLKLNTEVPPLALFNANLVILFLLFLMTILIGNSNRAFHHELEAERYLREHQYEDVLKVGRYSAEATRTLTALRAMAMAHQGTMGEELFLYPQYYKSEGLFFDNDSLKTLRYTNDSIYYLLGVRPRFGESHQELLRNICYKGTGKHVALDYYLSSLLLDKDLDSFAKGLTDFVDADAELPRYYNEALILYKDKHPEASIAVTDSAMIRRYDAFKERRLQFSFPSEERKNMRKEYGDTYWWYFQYQK